jgi:hypothetical protein
MLEMIRELDALRQHSWVFQNIFQPDSQQFVARMISHLNAVRRLVTGFDGLKNNVPGVGQSRLPGGFEVRQILTFVVWEDDFSNAGIKMKYRHGPPRFVWREHWRSQSPLIAKGPSRDMTQVLRLCTVPYIASPGHTGQFAYRKFGAERVSKMRAPDQQAGTMGDVPIARLLLVSG